MTLHNDVERILFTEAQILSGIDRVASAVTSAYDGRDFSVVAVLKGSCVFASDLIRRIPIPLELAFLSASSYGDGTQAGRLEINFFPTGNEIQGRNLLLVDDILDTGRTLHAVRQELIARGASEVRTCVFLDKPARRTVDLQPDFRVFEVEDLFVVGYGLDFAGRYRNLPYVGALRESIQSAGRTRWGTMAVPSYITIPPERAGLELDEFLCLTFPLLNKGFLRTKVREGAVLVDGMKASPSQRLREYQVLVVSFEEDEVLPDTPVAPTLRIPVLYEDASVIAVDKPSGLAAEPERWAKANASLAGALLSLALERSEVDAEEPTEPTPGLSFRPRLLHRLDKDTTGVVLVAKTIEAERVLRVAFEHGAIDKHYLALVEGDYPLAEGESEVIDLPIGPDERRSGRMRVERKEGKPAQTRVTVAQRFRGYTLLDCQPLTGRTHQIRVHLTELGFPLAVDPVYGRRRALSLSEFKRDYRRKPGALEHPLIERLTLHARSIDFPDPDPAWAETGRRIRVEAPLPRDLARLLKQMEKARPA